MAAKKTGTYYARNRERSLAQVKAYRELHREEVLAKGREWRLKNKEKIVAARKKRCAEMPKKDREQMLALRKQRRQQSSAERNARDHARRLEDPAPSMFRSARTRAKAQQIPFALTVDDVRTLYAEGQCECCGAFVQAERRETAGGPGRLAATIDRVIPASGYTPNNVALLCWTCNRRKNDSTLEQLEQIVAWLRSRQSQK